MSVSEDWPQPGDTVRNYARMRGWRLARRSVMVEGDSDVRYFDFAAEKYRESRGKQLIGADFSVFSAGSGGAGGTDGLYEEFPPLWKMVRADTDPNGSTLFRVAALVDNDRAGRILIRQLLDQYRAMLAWRDVFSLQHVLPMRASEPRVLAKHVDEQNALHRDLDCEVEDLLADQVIDAFLDVEEDALARATQEKNGFRHHEFRDAAKPRLWLFAREHCEVSDLDRVIGTLKALRFYLGLPPDGV